MYQSVTKQKTLCIAFCTLCGAKNSWLLAQHKQRLHWSPSSTKLSVSYILCESIFVVGFCQRLLWLNRIIIIAQTTITWYFMDWCSKPTCNWIIVCFIEIRFEPHSNQRISLIFWSRVNMALPREHYSFAFKRDLVHVICFKCL